MDSNLQKYIAFLKTAQYKSFTRAAQHLHYSQSGISRMIPFCCWNAVTNQESCLYLKAQYFISYLDCHPAYPKDSPYDHRVLTDSGIKCGGLN